MQEKSLEQLYTLDITLANTNWQSIQHGDFCGRPLVWFWVYNKHSLFHCHLQHFRHTFWALWGIKICQISQVYCVTYVGHIPIHNMNGKLSQINDTMYIWYGNDIQGCLALYSTPWLLPFKLRGWFARPVSHGSILAIMPTDSQSRCWWQLLRNNTTSGSPYTQLTWQTNRGMINLDRNDFTLGSSIAGP